MIKETKEIPAVRTRAELETIKKDIIDATEARMETFEFVDYKEMALLESRARTVADNYNRRIAAVIAKKRNISRFDFRDAAYFVRRRTIDRVTHVYCTINYNVIDEAGIEEVKNIYDEL